MDRGAARDSGRAPSVAMVAPGPARRDGGATDLQVPLVLERFEGPGPARLALHREQGATVAPLRWMLLYGGAPIADGLLPAGRDSDRVDVPALEDWMEDRQLSLRLGAGEVGNDGLPGDAGAAGGVAATCMRPPPVPPSRAEAAARRRWARLQGDGTVPARGAAHHAGSRRVTLWLPPRPEAPGTEPRRRTRPVNVYRHVAELVIGRRGPPGRDADGLEAPHDRPGSVDQ